MRKAHEKKHSFEQQLSFSFDTNIFDTLGELRETEELYAKNKNIRFFTFKFY